MLPSVTTSASFTLLMTTISSLDPFLVMGQKSDMEKAFGNKIRLLPKRLSDLNSATKYESRIIIQESDDEIANTATKNLVKKLQKKYNKEDIVVIKRVNEALVVTEGNMKNIKGEYLVCLYCLVKVLRGARVLHGLQNQGQFYRCNL
jgi:hypothetical protein